ncbi:MAG: histidinol-phosphate transaminase [Pseudomonadota bacterium]
MSKFWSNIVADLAPYVPGEQPRDQQYIKLNTNENPYPPSPAISALLREQDVNQLKRYPDPSSTDLVHTLAEYYAVAPTEVFVGNGSDEVLAHIFQAFFQKPEPLLFPDISYSFYPVYCGLYRIDYRQVPLDSNFCIDVDDYRQANGGIIIPNPNAPTGMALELAAIRQLLADNPESVVVVDEAYVDFGADSCVPLISEYPNLLVVQTFSKSRSLAGIRIGYAIGQATLIEGLQRVKNSFNSYPVDSISSQIASAAVKDMVHFKKCRDQIIVNREKLSAGLNKLEFEVFPSQANFVFTRHARLSAESLYRELKSGGILVRYFNKPRIDNFLRITVGTESECEALLDALKILINR